MKRLYRKLAVLAKIETTYGTDAVPTGAANAIQMTDVAVTPMEATELSRELLLPYLGHQGVELAGKYVRIEGSVEIAGAGAVDTPPAYGPLMRACGLAETITAVTKVDYQPVSGSFEAASIYFNQDGVRHVALGARGNVTLSIAPLQIPRYRFNLIGLLGTISDQALPTVDHSGFIRPVSVNKANTTLSLHGWSAIAESISIDLGNAVEPRFLIGAESMEVTDRQTTGTAVVEAKPLATVDWFAIATARTRGALALQQGTVAGNIVEIAAPAVEIGRPTQGQTQRIVNYSLPLMFVPSAGDDEITITTR